jgi:hypothetical protein
MDKKRSFPSIFSMDRKITKSILRIFLGCIEPKNTLEVLLYLRFYQSLNKWFHFQINHIRDDSGNIGNSQSSLCEAEATVLHNPIKMPRHQAASHSSWQESVCHTQWRPSAAGTTHVITPLPSPDPDLHLHTNTPSDREDSIRIDNRELRYTIFNLVRFCWKKFLISYRFSWKIISARGYYFNK